MYLPLVHCDSTIASVQYEIHVNTQRTNTSRGFLRALKRSLVRRLHKQAGSCGKEKKKMTF